MSNLFHRVRVLPEAYQLEAPTHFDVPDEESSPFDDTPLSSPEPFPWAPLDDQAGGSLETAPVAALAAAKEEATRLVAEAEREQRRILEEARKEVERLREEAYREGIEAGEREGRETGLAAMREEDREREERLARLLVAVHRERERLLQEAEGELLELAVEIARQIIVAEVKANREIVVEIVRAGLRRLTNKQGLVLHVSPEDRALLLEHKEELQAGEDLLTLAVVGDAQLKPGDCLIETTSGSVDGRLETRLAEARKLLRKRFEEWERTSRQEGSSGP